MGRSRGYDLVRVELIILLHYSKLKFREPARNIPQFMISYYKKTGKGTIPTPRVAGTRKRGGCNHKYSVILILSFLNIGSAQQYQLVWDGDDNLSEWVPQKDIINLEDAEVPSATERNCNTRKDRDKRKNRHTCGIFIG